MDFNPLKNEVTDSLLDGFRKRLTTPLYGTFLISWIIFHWEFLYTAFFVSEENILLATKMLKNDYLNHKFFNFFDWYFYASWILPFIVTWLIIWILPRKILLPAFEKEEEYRVEKIKSRIRFERQIVSEETSLAKETTKKFEAEKEKADQKKIVEKTDPTNFWEKEYLEFKNTKYFVEFDKVVQSVYKKGGRTEWDWGSTKAYAMSESFLAYLHTHELVTLEDGDQGEPLIALTDKGKYYVRKYSDDKIA